MKTLDIDLDNIKSVYELIRIQGETPRVRFEDNENNGIRFRSLVDGCFVSYDRAIDILYDQVCCSHSIV